MQVFIGHKHMNHGEIRSFLKVEADTLDVAVFLGNVFGWSLDVEQNKVTATHQKTGAKLVANGTSVTGAAAKLIDLLTEQSVVQEDV